MTAACSIHSVLKMVPLKIRVNRCFLYNIFFVCLNLGTRGGSGQFFSPRVGFRVFWFCSGRVSGFWFFFGVKRKIYRVTSGQKNICSGQTRVKIFCIFDKNSATNDQNLEKNAKNLLYFPLLTKIWPQMTKIWRKMQKIGFISHNFLTSGYSG